MKQTSGISLVETLIGLALTVVVLSASSTIFSSSASLYRNQSADADEAQAFAAGMARFSYELGLAGYKGTDISVENLDQRNFNGSPSLDISTASATDTITVRYYEDRWTGGTVQLKEVTYTTANNELIRKENNNSEVIAENINNLKVIKYLDKNGAEHSYTGSKLASDIYGITVAFNAQYSGKNNNQTLTSDQLFTVGFLNEQQN